MEREWTGNARRLGRADWAEIERLIRAGETFATMSGSPFEAHPYCQSSGFEFQE